MSTRGELEVALANAEAGYRGASHDLARARAERARAGAAWDQIVIDRRRAGADRRKAGVVSDRMLTDRRNADADRRIRDEDIAALSKTVADQHQAYLDRNKAETDWAAAQARLTAATAEREMAITSLGALDHAQSEA